MKFTAQRSIATNKISGYVANQTVAGKKLIIRQIKSARGTWWEVQHHLAGGHVFDHGFATRSTLAEAKDHAIAMLAQYGN